MILYKTILILEDNLSVLSKLCQGLYDLEQEQPFDLSVIVLTTADQVVEYINSNPNVKFDIVLIDRDCKLNKSFHILDLERFGVEKAIAISSIEVYNLELEKRGVKGKVTKDLTKLDTFTSDVITQIESKLLKKPSQFTL